jgi:hypothetical protein
MGVEATFNGHTSNGCVEKQRNDDQNSSKEKQK